jgi:SecD/SecF fusion protein
MQNKGAIITFTALLFAVCIYQLSFTWKSNQIEKRAKVYAKGSPVKENAYLDSVKGVEVYNFLGLKKFTYKDVKELELGLGLDLRGGMNVTLEVSVVDVIRAMSNYNADSTFSTALKKASELQKNSTQDYVTLFGQAFQQIDPNAKLAAIFNTLELKDRVKFNSTNEEVLKVIRQETDAAIDNSFNVLRTRIDRFGVAQPNIQSLQTRGRILVELPGINDPLRVRKLLQGTATLEFWETYDNQEVYPFLLQANQRVKELTASNVKKAETNAATPAGTAQAAADSTKATSLIEEMKKDTSSAAASKASNLDNFRRDYPLFAVLSPSVTQQGNLYPGPVVGTSQAKDTAEVNALLAKEQIKSIFPRNMFFRWTANSVDKNDSYFRLIALKSTSRDGKAPLNGDVITDARQDYDQMNGRPEVSMAMNSEGAKTWARMTKENIGKSIAILLDGYVRSFPNVINEITGGRSSITGLGSIEEATDLANILKSGKMPAPAHIMQEEFVGPSLGKEAISAGFASFAIAFLLVLAYMLFFYSTKAGMAANIALLFNVLFLIGVLASLGAVLTLPGIAGIVLTMGMAVDANVLIYERVQEEIWGGKGLKLAISDGYKHAYSAIIDGQVTTLLTGIILYLFGSGPIKGFATTLVIGILTSLFTSIFITRLIFEWQLKRNMNITFTSKATSQWLRHTKIKFIENRKYAYMFSGALIVLSIISLTIRGFDYGIDFQGGRTYTVRFDQDVKVADVRSALTTVYGSAPEVKTFGGNNQVRITTSYKIEDLTDNVDNEVEQLMYKGLTDGGLLKGVSFDDFIARHRMSSQKVGPTISYDIKKDAAIAVFLALIVIFLYVAVRFTNWQYGLGGIVALAHDAFITMGIFSMFWGILPFSLEIDQAFIAAILTIIGYSINDTVIIFDRIREYLHLYPKRDEGEIMDYAMNSTLRRTFSTSLTVLIVLFAIFIFGGASIRGFTFALLIGVGIGTYSSVFVATPLVYETKKRFGKRLKTSAATAK